MNVKKFFLRFLGGLMPRFINNCYGDMTLIERKSGPPRPLLFLTSPRSTSI